MHKTPLALAAAAALATACAQPGGALVEPQSYAASCEEQAPLERPLKIANYNIKSGTWSTLGEIADVLEAMDADVIALEEVDNGLPRTGYVDQSQWLADRLGAKRVFAPAWQKEGGSYGIALLSKVPLAQAESFQLPDANGFEPRVAIDAIVCAGQQELHVVGSHADFLPWSAEAHAVALADHVDTLDDVVLMGDLNIPPENSSLASFVAGGLHDVLSLFTDAPTFADARIDYIWSDREASEAAVVESEASDHKPVWAKMPFDAR